MVILRGAYTPRILRYAAAVAESGMKSSAGKYDTALLGSSKVKLTSEQTQKDDRPHHDESRQDFTPENVDAPSLDGSPRSAAGSQKVRGRSRDHMCDILRCDPMVAFGVCSVTCSAGIVFACLITGFSPRNPARGSLGCALITLRYAPAVAESRQR
jgi:hypothetical protein